MALKAVYLNRRDFRAAAEAGQIADYALSEEDGSLDYGTGWYVWSDARGLYDGPYSRTGAGRVIGARTRQGQG